MIVIALAALSLKAGLNPSAPPWVSQALASNAAKIALVRAKAHRSTKRVSDSRGSSATQPAPSAQTGKVTVASADPYVNPVADRELKIVNTNLQMIGWLWDKNDYPKAFATAQNLRNQYPQWEGAYIDIFIIAEYLAGRIDDAYLDVVSAVNKPLSTVTEGRMLLLSLLSAKKGWVYPGQLGYCQATLLSRMKLEDPSWIPCLPEWDPQNTNDVAEASCLALEYWAPGGSPWAFLEEALKINPSDVVAAGQLVNFYQRGHQFSDLRRVANGILRRLGRDSGVPKFFKLALDRSEGLADGPPRPPPSVEGLIKP